MKLLVVLMAASLASFGAGCGSSSKQATPALSVGSSSVKAASGQSFNLTASLNPAKTPTGSVTFFDGGTQIGEASVSLSGYALLSVNSLSIGTHEITASYSGDVNNAAVTTKNPFNQVITGTTTITVTAAPASGTAPNDPGITHSFNLPVTLQ
jgi:large repetitive protein